MTHTNPQPDHQDELRQAAENRLESGPLHAGNPSEADTLRLLHELQVHQIELEMQNTELRESQLEAEAARRSFSDLYDFAPVGYFSLNRAGDIARLNLAGARMLGAERSKLMHASFRRFVEYDDQPKFDSFLERVFNSDTRHACEVALHCPGLPRSVVYIDAEHTSPSDECRAAVTDITDRRNAEQELRIARALAQSTLDGLSSLICVIDKNGAVVRVNESWRRHAASGSAGDTMFPQQVVRALRAPPYADEPRDVARLCEGIQAVLSGRVDRVETECECPRNEKPCWFLARVTRFGEGGDAHAILALEDITRIKRDEARLKRLMHELDHRVKNNLATIIALAQQTITHASSLCDFEHQFIARVLAIKRTHETLTRVRWHDIELSEVVRASLEASILAGQVDIPGDCPSIAVGPRAATVLSMAIFELATNAMKYGSLSTPRGRTRVRWALERDASGESLLSIHWHEHGGPTVHTPMREGFGTMLIRDSLRHDLHATAQLHYHPAGFEYRLVIPEKFLSDPIWVE